MQRTTAAAGEVIAPLFTGEDVLRFHALVRKVPIAEDLVRFAVRLASGTRPRQKGTPSVERMLAPMSDSVCPTSLGASAAITAARSVTTLRNTLRVTGMGELCGPSCPRSRVITGT